MKIPSLQIKILKLPVRQGIPSDSRAQEFKVKISVYRIPYLFPNNNPKSIFE